MSAGSSPAPSLRPVSTRKVPRFKLAIPLDLTVLRSGIPDNLRGRTLEIGEGGLGVVVASQLLLGESVRVEFLLPHMSSPVRATAVVRYQRAQIFGLQFLRLPDEHKATIQYWTRHEADVSFTGQRRTPGAPGAQSPSSLAGSLLNPPPGNPKNRWSLPRLLGFVFPFLVVALILGWWQWESGWKELESQVPATQDVAAPELRVASDVMQKRLVHQIAPQYPEAARQAGVRGTVLLDLTVNADGAVSQVKVLSGPDQLTSAASEAVRWWRYEPYLVNGRPTAVETSVAIDFQMPFSKTARSQ
jgi:TonB family protein